MGHVRYIGINLYFPSQQGFGMLLMEEAERIAKDEHGSNKISVISGIKQPSNMNVKLFTCIMWNTPSLVPRHSQILSCSYRENRCFSMTAR